jgi:hypothetical protein
MFNLIEKVSFYCHFLFTVESAYSIVEFFIA